MSDAARAAFEAHAEGYDAERRRLLPCFDAFYAAAIEAVGLSERRPERVLDLGAGTGLLAGFVAQAFPAARLTLLDGAGAMLAQARERLRERPSTSSATSPTRCPRARGTRSSRRWRSTTSTMRPSATSSSACARQWRRAACSSTPSRSPARPRGSTPSRSSAAA